MLGSIGPGWLTQSLLAKQTCVVWMLQNPDCAQSAAVVQATAVLMLQVPLFGMQAPPVVVGILAGLQVVPLFWLLPHTLATSQSESAAQLVELGLPAVHVPGTAVQLAFVVQDSGLFVHVPACAHCAVFPVAVQVALTAPAGQVPTSWQGTLLALLVVQVLPKVAPALVQVPTCLHCAAVVHAVLG
ncbi:MAG: hypothetical protein ACREDY_28535, partial [Bradyrhizobium sp.]